MDKSPNHNDPSKGVGPMQSRRFLLKINAADCPAGIAVPEDAADWEGKVFRSDKPRRSKAGHPLPLDETHPPEKGEHLMIWVNDAGGGSGLMATAQVSNCTEEGRRLNIQVADVTLLPAPRLNRIDLNRISETSDVFDDIRRSTVQQLRFLADSAWEEITSEAKKKAGGAEHGIRPPTGVASPVRHPTAGERAAANAYLLAYLQDGDDSQTTVQATTLSPSDYLAKLAALFAQNVRFTLLHAEPVSDLDGAWERLQAMLAQQSEDLMVPVERIPRAAIISLIRKVAREYRGVG